MEVIRTHDKKTRITKPCGRGIASLAALTLLVLTGVQALALQCKEITVWRDNQGGSDHGQMAELQCWADGVNVTLAASGSASGADTPDNEYGKAQDGNLDPLVRWQHFGYLMNPWIKFVFNNSYNVTNISIYAGFFDTSWTRYGVVLRDAGGNVVYSNAPTMVLGVNPNPAVLVLDSGMSITASAATNVTAISAYLNGALVSTNASPTYAWVCYGDNDAGTNLSAWDVSYPFGSVAVGPLTRLASGLTETTTYYCRYFASNSAGVAWSGVSSFQTLVDNSQPWQAYNDLAWTTGQTTTRITRLSFYADANHTTNGILIRYGDGKSSGVTLNFSGGSSASTSAVATVGAGTPAGQVFDGKVDTETAMFLPGGTNGVMTLSGLDPTHRYKLVLFGNRDNSSYTTRWTTLTLSGADSFINSSSADAVISGASSETTTIVCGTNTGGLVFVYTDVRPGGDGQVQIDMSGNNQAAYLNALMLEQIAEGPAAPVVANDTATGVSPKTATMSGMLSSTGSLPTEVWLYWKVGTDGGTNKANWTFSNAFGNRGVGSLSHAVTNLTPDTSYCYRYYASNSMGEAWASAATAFYTPAFVVTSAVPMGATSPRQSYASNRRAGLIVSEIMYEPRAPFGDNGEFIEIYNTQSYAEDLTGWRISGEVDYLLPTGTVIGARSFLVVAANPVWLMGTYQISGVLGPYSNKLSNGGGVIRIRDDANAIVFETEYDNKGQWPVTAGGAGHSLVLTRPDYGEGDARAWEASALAGGNPARSNQTIAASYNLQNLCINEVLAHTDLPQQDCIELFNRGTSSINLAGCWLSDNPSNALYQIPSGTLAPGACVAFVDTQMGFNLSMTGEGVFLFNPEKDIVLDAVLFDAQENGVSIGRYPDGAPGFHELSAVTTGSVNRATTLKIRPVVINEIMYNPPSGDDNDEFVEIYNKGASTMDLSYWRFTSGVDYMFPPGTTIAAGSYLVVAKSRAQFLGKYTNVNASLVLGDYNGSLSDRGEHLVLGKPDDPVLPYQDFVVMDEVRYSDGWTEESDGGGSSLELRDPRADNRLAANWTDSDESAKAPWTTIEKTVNLDAEDGPHDMGWDTNTGHLLYTYYLKQLQIYLNGGGECLIDDVHVTRGATEFVQNPTLDSGATDWILTHGNHKDSVRISSGGVGNTGCIQLKAQGGGSAGVNALGVDLNNGLAVNDTSVTLSLKARWLKGNSHLSVRLHGNGLWAAGLLVMPDNLGTPGAQNSRYAANVGPDIDDMFYTPVLPAASQTVTVTARLQDADGVQGADLKWRIDPSTSYTTTAMNDSGTAPDAIANDGIWSGTVNGQSANTVVGFYISARDNNGSTVRVYPALAPTQEVYMIFGVTNGAVGDYGVFRFIVPPSRDGDNAAGIYYGWDKMDNMYWDVTLLYNDSRIIPNVGTRLGGSNLSRPKPGVETAWWETYNNAAPNFRECNGTFRFKIPKDDRLCGSTFFGLDNMNNQNRARVELSPCDPTFVLEDIMGWMARTMGLKATRQRYVHVFGNNYHKGIIYADLPSPQDDFIDAYLPDSTDGETYETRAWDECAKTTANNMNLYASPSDADNAPGDPESPFTYIKAWKHDDGALRDEMYRMVWDKKALHPRDTDVSSIVNVAVAIDRPIDTSAASQKAYLQGLDQVVDWEQWARSFAFRHAIADSDNWGNYGRNKYMHIPKSGKAILLDFDYDSGLGLAPQYGMKTDGNRSTLSGDVFCGWGTSLTMMQDTILSNQFMKCYAVQRAYWRGVKDMVDGPMSAARADAQIDKLYNAHVANNIAAWKNQKPTCDDSMTMTAGELTEAKAWTAKRRDYILNGGGTPFTASLTNTTFTASGPASSATKVFQITGSAPVQAKTIQVNGVAIQNVNVTWTSVLNYTMDVSASAAGSQIYAVSALDSQGLQVGAMQNVTVDYTGAYSSPSGQIVITEIMYDPAVSGGGYVELYNKSSTETFDLAGLQLNGADFIFPAGSILAPQQYRVVAGSEAVFYETYSTNPTLVFGQYSGTLDNGGETVSLEMPSGTNWVVIDQVKYDDDLPWPVAARGTGCSLQLIDVNQDNDRLANWACAPLGVGATTPGRVNAVAGTLSAIPRLWLSEAMPNNGALLQDNAGDFEPWVELFNSDGSTFNLTSGSFYLTDDYTNLTRWAFPNSPTLAAGARRLVWVDGETGETVGTNHVHTPFRASGAVGGLALVQINNSRTTVVDYVNYSLIPTNKSYGSFPDDNSWSRQVFDVPTPGVLNDPTSQSNLVVYINEWCAANKTVLADPADGQCEDWIELFNPNGVAVDLSGWMLTDNLEEPGKYVIPTGRSIPAHGYLLIWADNESGQTTAGSELHAAFSLSAVGESIGLFTPDGRQVNYVTFGAQADDVSEGRYPDGSAPIFAMNAPSPRTANTLVGLPQVANDGGAINVQITTATLQGNVASTGSSPTTVWLFWGTTDAGTVSAAWQQQQSLGLRVVGTVSAGVSSLAPSTTYFYRYMASNAVGVAWAPTASNFTSQAATQAPTVNNDAGASGVTATTAWLNGTLSSTGGLPTTVFIAWGDNNAGISTTGAWDAVVSLGLRVAGAFSNQVTALNPNRTYYYASYATNATGGSWAAVTNFTTLSAVPIVSTVAASGVTTNSAWLNGTLASTGGVPTTVYLCWGDNDGGSTSTGGWDFVVSLGVRATGAFSNQVTGLLPNQGYYSRSFAMNSAGSSWAASGVSFTTPAAVPAVSAAGGASGVTPSSAWLNGLLSATGGAPTTVVICWGDNDGGSLATGSWDTVVNLGVRATGAFSNQVTGLSSAQGYYYACFASNAAGGAWSPASGFTTPTSNGPAINNGIGASGITTNAAWVNGSLTSTGGLSTAVFICWGDNNAGTTSTGSWDTVLSLGTLPVGTFSNLLSGLSLNQAYYYVCFATNAAGGSWASISSFTTLAAAPGVTMVAASGIGSTNVTLNATVTTTGGAPTTVWMYYGATDGGTTPGAWTSSINLGVRPAAAVSTTVASGLLPGTKYYYRAYASNSIAGVWASSSTNFTTLAAAPVVSTLDATGVGITNATLNGSLGSTGGAPTQVWIYYGTTNGGTTQGLWSASANLGVRATGGFSQVLTAGLLPGTVYYCRAYASNAAAGVWAATGANFTTLASPSGDTDGDGMPNSWETLYFGGDTNGTASVDADADGQSNLQEYIAGTDPTNAGSLFRVLTIRRVGGTNSVEWFGGTNGAQSAYRVMGRTNLLSGNWVELGQHSREAGTNTWSDGNNPAIQFYRVSATN